MNFYVNEECIFLSPGQLSLTAQGAYYLPFPDAPSYHSISSKFQNIFFLCRTKQRAKKEHLISSAENVIYQTRTTQLFALLVTLVEFLTFSSCVMSCRLRPAVYNLPLEHQVK